MEMAVGWIEPSPKNRRLLLVQKTQIVRLFLPSSIWWELPTLILGKSYINLQSLPKKSHETIFCATQLDPSVNYTAKYMCKKFCLWILLHYKKFQGNNKLKAVCPYLLSAVVVLRCRRSFIFNETVLMVKVSFYNFPDLGNLLPRYKITSKNLEKCEEKRTLIPRYFNLF